MAILPAPASILRARAHLTAEIRAFFAARDFVEVDTPVALRAPAPEAAIHAVPVRFAGPTANAPLTRYLQTSPELAMKRLVAHGLPQIFQLAAVFRDGDYSAVHRPEFRLLEWYRAPAPYTALLGDCEALLAHLAAVAATLGLGARAQAGAQALRATPYPRVRMHDAFVRHADIDLAAAPTRALLAEQLVRRGLHHAASDSWADLFHRAFVGVVEPALLAAHPGPFFLTHFPAQLASLAQLDPEDAAVAQRFELYAGGMELANGFGELRDAQEQRRRFDAENAARAAEGHASYPLDEAYLDCLGKLPPTAGIALGLERLLLILLGQTDMDAISFVPWSLTP